MNGFRTGDLVWHPDHGWGRFTCDVGVTMARVDFASGSERVESVSLKAGDDPTLPDDAQASRP